jgi:pimeloyl-ACP methyl ester carboxylesterase
VLVLWGDRDTLIPIDQGREFTAVLEGAVFKVFEGCGHYLHNEQPEACVQVVREFLDDPTVASVQLRSPAPNADEIPSAVA